jgi:glycosyltransferase involved in cell wall biosynthesis
MRIVIDLQVAQAESCFHGIGRFSLSLARAIVCNRGNHEVLIALNGLFPEKIEPIRVAFDGLLPPENIRIWYAPGPVCERQPGNTWRREAAERIREAFLVSLQPDVVLVTSLFEGFVDDAVTSIGVFDKKTPIVVILYDLIPFMDLDHYLCPNPTYEKFNLRNVEDLKRASAWLTVSGSSAQEMVDALGLREDHLFNISGMSIDECSRRAIAALERLYAEQHQSAKSLSPPDCRPKLAYISPLPPERSGISDYSAELLPELTRYYDIEVIVDQPEISDSWVLAHLTTRSVEYFKKNADIYGRILYHFGNSSFHKHMLDLLDRFPGVVVLHDFFLGDFYWYMESIIPGTWIRELYNSHGYIAVWERFHLTDLHDVVFKYPCNFTILQKALGLIVHSRYSAGLAQEWYGLGKDWSIIPQLHASSKGVNRIAARKKLGIEEDSLLVCSFGIMGPTKQNHRLLSAWINSSLASDPRCQLIFVGENHGDDDYGQMMLEKIRESGLQDRIHITGWADPDTFHNFLKAADIAVQLRSSSRGETSRAVLDCMEHGLATIVNANGALAELSEDAVYMLLDDFDDSELIIALETLSCDPARRQALGEIAREVISRYHSPRLCADMYAQSLEMFYDRAKTSRDALIDSLARLDGLPTDNGTLANLAVSIAQSLPLCLPAPRLFLDISITSRLDMGTGIERVSRALTQELIRSAYKGYRAEPIFLTDEGERFDYHYARHWTWDALSCPCCQLTDEKVDFKAGDILLVPDLTYSILVQAERSGVYQKLKNDGIEIFFIVYDLLPIQMPHVFPPGADETYKMWLTSACRVANGIVCISQSTMTYLLEWLTDNGPNRLQPLKIGWSHLGADIENSIPTCGLPDDAQQVLAQLSVHPSFLMVGTIEPRKGHAQTLAAFEQLWSGGTEVNLVVVGRVGWKHLPNDMLRTLPETADLLQHHPELGRQLFWLEGISDEYLDKVYASCTCLIAASEGEGFGLPLIEAAQHKLPIIARDIPVFREVAGEHAYYFSGRKPSNLAEAIKGWLELFQSGQHPKSSDMPWMTWKESAERLLDIILNEQWYTEWGCNANKARGEKSG